MSQANEMEELARAAFYIQDIAKGAIGSFKIEEEGWGQGDGPRAYQDIKDCLALLDMDGWKRDNEVALMAPYTANIRRAVLKKKFPKPIGWRWVTVTLAERFGVDCTFTSLDEQPWKQ